MSLTVTDLFCGGGGSSTGMTQIPGVQIRMAANHWDLAVEVHNTNHPDADHAAVDLHEEDPRYFPRTDILWASPECTKWSQAAGGKYAAVSTFIDGNLLDLLNPELVEEDEETKIIQRSRLLMFDVLRFVEHHRYRAMVVENVVDIATNPKYAPEWALWRKGLRNLGYDFRVVSLNSMHAQKHGDPAPQSRDRLYIVCWRKGDRAPDIDSVLRPLAWCPTCGEVVESQQAWKNGRTVGKYRSQYVYIHAGCGATVEPGYLPAAAAIDWSLRGTRIGDRTKELAEKTRRRIAAGIAKYWRPFTLEAAGNTYERQPGVRTWPTDEPLRTLHTTLSKAVAVPDAAFILERRGEYRVRGLNAPLSTLVANETTKALVVPLEGRAGDRVNTADQPLRTQTSRHLDAIVTPAGGSWNDDARPASEPLRALTTRDAYGLVTPPPFIAELRGGGSDARPVEQPMSTVTASGNHHALVTPYYGSSDSAQPVDKPIGTLTTVDRYALLTRHYSSKGDGAEMTTPVTDVMRTLTATAQQSVVTPGDIEAAEAQVDDCLFRMLEPHEVAAGMAFPADYVWRGTRRERVRLAGNAVTPPAARDLIAAVAEALA